MQGREATRNPPHHWGWKPRGLRRVPFCQDVSLRILAATNSSVNRIKAVGAVHLFAKQSLCIDYSMGSPAPSQERDQPGPTHARVGCKK
jgi:hypothetical protein